MAQPGDDLKFDGYMAQLINQSKSVERKATCPTCKQEIVKKDGVVHHLIIVTGKNTGVYLPVPEGKTIIIGRGDDCDVRLADPMTSRHHCELKGTPKFCVLSDLESANGTFVNGSKITNKQLTRGDTIEVGGTKLAFSVGEN